jgi:transposase
MDLALAMIAAALAELPSDPQLHRLKARAYAVDSTTIDLCLELFPWASFRRAKGAVKAHTVLDLHQGIPTFVRVSCGKSHDVLMLDHIAVVAGAFYVFDKAYLDFARLYRLHTAGAFFVTRPKGGMDFRVVQRRAVLAYRGVRSDRLIRLRGPKSRKRYPDTLRLIRYTDPQTGKRLSFLTNNLKLSASTIALLYRKRWKIEQFFRWIKQHLHIKGFFGTTPNAVQTQIWIAVAAYVLLARLKHLYQLPQELGEIANIVRVSVLEKTPVFELFSQSEPPSYDLVDRKQLRLFD